MEELMEQRITDGISYTTGAWPPDPKKSTLVFIHGAGGSSAFWSGQVQDLAASFNTIAVDLPGHGRCGGDGKASIKDYGQVVVDFVNQVGFPKPILCGLSMGGAITQQLLIDYPDRFEAGILISTGAKLKVAPIIFESIENEYKGFVEMMGKLAASPKTAPGPVQIFSNDLAGCNPTVTHGDFQACNGFDALERLSDISVPVLVVSAQEDKLTPPKYADVLEKEIKDVSRAHILDAGHIVPLEKPAEINAVILEFSRRNGL
jgi:pimeloyl-ACP methyl ester carboxylesterase